MKKKCVYLGLGGNQGDVLSRLKQALTMLSNTPLVSDLKISHFYQTAPIQVDNPGWFVNAVCSFWTPMTLQEVFKMTQLIEIQLGKVKKPKSGDRPIDIDILFYGIEICNESGLEIPHPRWKERLFVLIPLADLTNEIFLQMENGLIRHLVLGFDPTSFESTPSRHFLTGEKS